LVGLISHFEQKRKGWSKKGEECIIDLKNIKGKEKYQRYSVLMATSNNKIINYTIVEKGIKSETFNKFMNKLNIMDKKQKNIYFMDNASVHTSKKFNILKDKLKLNVIYNAPYHSEFNPIEYVFSLLRKNIQSNINNSKENIIKIINIFNKNISSIYLEKIFNHSFELMEKFLGLTIQNIKK
jgi:transposase